MAPLVIVCTIIIGPPRGVEFRTHRQASLCVASPDTSLSRVGRVKMTRGSEGPCLQPLTRRHEPTLLRCEEVDGVSGRLSRFSLSGGTFRSSPTVSTSWGPLLLRGRTETQDAPWSVPGTRVRLGLGSAGSTASLVTCSPRGSPKGQPWDPHPHPFRELDHCHVGERFPLCFLGNSSSSRVKVNLP